jgi:hypothetical protein
MLFGNYLLVEHYRKNHPSKQHLENFEKKRVLILKKLNAKKLKIAWWFPQTACRCFRASPIQITEQEYESRLPHDDEIEILGRFSIQELKTMILNDKIITSISISILSRFFCPKTMNFVELVHS